jgi:O-antigen ligase
MPPILALFLWVVLLVALFRVDWAKTKTSPSLWVPLTWLFIIGSRLPSQWLGGHRIMSAQALEDGNPLDRAIFLALILLALGVLMARSFKWGSFLQGNLALAALMCFALVSATWSDFPFIAFKRWIRDVGTYFMVLVVISDARPVEAVRTVLRRLSYLLVPLSIVLDKYFPEMSKQYDPWTGAASYAGVTTSKNMLGLLCLVSGLFFFWDTLARWSERKQDRAKRIILLDAAFFAMTVWLLHISQSTTSSICLVLGCLVIASAHSRIFRRRPALLKALIPAAFGLYVILDLVFGMSGSMAQAVGKDPTLHDRTKIWAFLLSMHTNVLVGTGYQSFWLGPRLEWFWENAHLGYINEAHNGYLEVYLEMGLIGCGLLVIFLITTYRGICRRLETSPSLAILGLAVWMAVVFYNMSEAAFEDGLLYMVFLMVAILPVRSAAQSVRNVVHVRPKTALQDADRMTPLSHSPSELTSQRR